MTKWPDTQWYPGDWRKNPGFQAFGNVTPGIWFGMLILKHFQPTRPTDADLHYLCVWPAGINIYRFIGGI